MRSSFLSGDRIMGPISEAETVVMFMCIYNFEALHISSLNYVLSA